MNDLPFMTAANPPVQEQRQPSLDCPCAGRQMALIRVNPKLGALPELRTYRCGQCGAVETVEVKQAVPAAR